VDVGAGRVALRPDDASQLAREDGAANKESENAGTGGSSGTGVLGDCSCVPESAQQRIIESAGHAQR
jgi:hypothetical protein